METTRNWLKTIVLALLLLSSNVPAQWTQWGGPNQNFTIGSVTISTEWPKDGPKEIWRRDLGDGYSAISVDNGILYTMTRRSGKEATVALNAADGKTAWEFSYDFESSVIILSCLFLSLWGGSIRFTTPMLFALGFLPMFGIGGLTGLPLGLAPTDIHLHDTYYVIGHFHYVVAPGTILAMFAGIYYWFPKATGRKMNDLLGKIHFWGTIICMNIVFMPMFIQGMAGVNRRLYDGGATYDSFQHVLHWNEFMSVGAWMLGVFQIPFIINLFMSIKKGTKVNDNAWEATTLEWSAAPSPPVGHGNFTKVPDVYRGAYDYSVPGSDRDFIPQNEPEERETVKETE